MSLPMITASAVTIILIAATVALMVLYWRPPEPVPAGPLIRYTSSVLAGPPAEMGPVAHEFGPCCAVCPSMYHSTPGMPVSVLVPQGLPGLVAGTATGQAHRAGEFHPASAA